ncbi:DUF4178 domain-containing protein [Actibacterium mucosum]|uniref:DUF4178 domain-containing protein n=1 Tax=Actibacterium mucosum TaxID=1087332 RepID=UPI001F304963|nr:DUF4178 domain-containing protein [Actibacterium mucosum]
MQDDVARLAGEQGVMHDAPMLFGVGDLVINGGVTVAIHGHARFSYGRGFWDEFWGLDEAQNPVWISVDEGDVVLQRKVHEAPIDARASMGTTFNMMDVEYTVTERETAECVAVRGSFDEELAVGETFTFLNCTGEYGGLASGEFWPQGEAWFVGRWLDPFEIEIVRANGAAS